MNIIFSLLAHAGAITTAFMVGWGWTSSVPADLLTVSLVSGLSEITVLNALDQKKQAIHSPVSSSPDAAASGHHNYGHTVKDRTPPETERDKDHIMSPAREAKTAERNPEESQGAKIDLKGHMYTQGGSSSSLSASYQSLPEGIAATVGPGHDPQSKGAHTQDGKAIRKAIEKALIYPLFARERGWEGTALTEFTVNAKGYPEEIRIVGSSGHDILDSAAKESLSKAAPFTVGKGRYEIPIRFSLKNN